MIQFVLITLLLLILIYIILGKDSSKMKAARKSTVYLCVIAGCIFVFRPELANHVAGWFGVGRGADLLLYITSIIVFGFIIFNHLQSRRQAIREAEIVRQLAFQANRLADVEMSLTEANDLPEKQDKR